MNEKISLGIKLAVVSGFILSIAVFFMTFLDLYPLDIESALSGVDIINLPDKMKEYSNIFNMISLVVPNLIISIENGLIIISRCLIAINIISILGAIFTLVIRKSRGFIASIAAVIINISILIFVSLRISNEINNAKETIGATLERFINLFGVNITTTGNIEAVNLMGSGLKLWIGVQGLIIILSILGIIFRDKQTVNKTA